MPIKKVQTQLLVPEVTRDRADALALAINETRAEVLRRALDGGGLDTLEKTYAEQLSALDPIASALGMKRHTLVRQMLHEGLALADWDPTTGTFRNANGTP